MISLIIILSTIIAIAIGLYYYKNKSSFKNTLVTPLSELDNSQPVDFPPISKPNYYGTSTLSEPDVPEEIGFAMKYPQGSGVSMARADSNSFGNTDSLLTGYKTPESYGESSLSDPTGNLGAIESSRILKINNTGNQMSYNSFDESIVNTYSPAYNQGEVIEGPTFINGESGIKYTDNFNPSANLVIQASPGQRSTLAGCETIYPHTVKYNDFCITEGDIPYGQVINNKVNPRLVSRWESFTGNYSRESALTPIDGVLYPNLNVLTNS